MKKLILDVIGMLLVGDGLLTLVDPKRHCLVWEIGPEPCRKIVDEFVQHPNLSRIAGAVEVVAGILLAEAQKPLSLPLR